MINMAISPHSFDYHHWIVRLAVQKSYSYVDLSHSVLWYRSRSCLSLRSHPRESSQLTTVSRSIYQRLQQIQTTLQQNEHWRRAESIAPMLELSLEEAIARRDFHQTSLRNVVPLSPLYVSFDSIRCDSID